MGFEVLFQQRSFEGGRVEPRTVGTLKLPTGRIVVCDPSSKAGDPLARAVAPGEYAVDASVATVDGEQRIAAMRVTFADRPIARWEPALAEGQDPSQLEPGEFFGYGVDAATACFVDASIAKDVGFDHFDKQIMPAMTATDDKLLAATATVPLASANLCACSTGAGDGMYASFWGFDDADEPVALVTEFRIIGDEETKGAELIEKYWPGVARDPDPLALFEIGRQFEEGKVTRVIGAGAIDVTSGRIRLGSPDTESPMTIEVPNGRHAIKVAMARRQVGHEIVEIPNAIAIEFTNDKPATWELVAPDGVDLVALGTACNGLSWDTYESRILCIGDASLALDVARVDSALGERTSPKFATITVDGKQVFAYAPAAGDGSECDWGITETGERAMLVTLVSNVGWEVAKIWEIRDATKQRAAAAKPVKKPAPTKQPAKKSPAKKPAKKKKPSKKKSKSKR